MNKYGNTALLPQVSPLEVSVSYRNYNYDETPVDTYKELSDMMAYVATLPDSIEKVNLYNYLEDQQEDMQRSLYTNIFRMLEATAVSEFSDEKLRNIDQDRAERAYYIVSEIYENNPSMKAYIFDMFLKVYSENKEYFSQRYAFQCKEEIPHTPEEYLDQLTFIQLLYMGGNNEPVW